MGRMGPMRHMGGKLRKTTTRLLSGTPESRSCRKAMGRLGRAVARPVLLAHGKTVLLNGTPESRSRAVVTEYNPPLRNTVPLNGAPKSRKGSATWVSKIRGASIKPIKALRHAGVSRDCGKVGDVQTIFKKVESIISHEDKTPGK